MLPDAVGGTVDMPPLDARCVPGAAARSGCPERLWITSPALARGDTPARGTRLRLERFLSHERRSDRAKFLAIMSLSQGRAGLPGPFQNGCLAGCGATGEARRTRVAERNRRARSTPARWHTVHSRARSVNPA